jgi:hypothetical protein
MAVKAGHACTHGKQYAKAGGEEVQNTMIRTQIRVKFASEADTI